MPTYRCEVLILGGGILGLWVLDRLRKQGVRSPILLESELLGCRQTGHSDAFLHQGYAYFATQGVQVFFDAWTAWQPWLPLPEPPITPPPAHHVFLDPSTHQRVVTWRQNPAFPPPPGNHQFNAQNPDVGIPHNAIETDERCVPGDWMVGRLQDGYQAYIRKIREIQQILLDVDPASGALGIRSVSVLLKDGSAALFEPNILLLCAGEQNRVLLGPRTLTAPAGVSLPSAFASLKQLQKEVDLDMLVVRDPTGTLPIFNGSLSGGLVADPQGQDWNVEAFVVSRRDLNQDLVWIASGRAYRTDSAMKPISNRTGRPFRRLLIDYLSMLFPAFKQSQPKMLWGVYPARLTVWNRPAGANLDALARRTFTDMGVEGLLVCFTDRLTITPLAAEEIEKEIGTNPQLRRRTASVPLPVLPPDPTAIHPEYWRTPGRWETRTSWTWPDFQANCL